ncbi:MAG: hypothetical protein AAGJ40_09120 [Planctomycetota bacterium]
MATQFRLFMDDENHKQRNNRTTTTAAIPRQDPESRRLLDFLMHHGTCPCKTIDELFHDGRKSLRELRIDGHRIESRPVNGVPAYVYKGFTPRVRITESQQARYYASDHWRRTSAERKSVDGFVCTQCGGRERLETHHWRYDLFNEDVLYDLQTLCRGCHQRLHERLRESRIYFPRAVPPAVARALGWAG